MTHIQHQEQSKITDFNWTIYIYTDSAYVYVYFLKKVFQTDFFCSIFAMKINIPEVFLQWTHFLGPKHVGIRVYFCISSIEMILRATISRKNLGQKPENKTS